MEYIEYIALSFLNSFEPPTAFVFSNAVFLNKITKKGGKDAKSIGEIYGKFNRR